MANIICSREGGTQVEPLSMVDYGILILLLIKVHKLTYPDGKQPRYANNSGSLGIFDHLEKYFNSLKRNFLARGYYPNPTKIIMIVHLNNLEEGCYLASVMGLMCARRHVILAVMSGVTNPKEIG